MRGQNVYASVASKRVGVVSTLPSTRIMGGTVSETTTGRPRSTRPGNTNRRVLIVEEEAAIRNVIYVLLADLGCQGEVAQSAQQALTMVSRESFDAVLLDLRSADLPLERLVTEIGQIQPNLAGRLLLITGSGVDSQDLNLAERLRLPCIPRQRVMEEMWHRLRPLLNGSH